MIGFDSSLTLGKTQQRYDSEKSGCYHTVVKQ